MSSSEPTTSTGTSRQQEEFSRGHDRTRHARSNKVDCRYGLECHNLNCKFSHPSDWNKSLAKANKGKVICRYGVGCRDQDSCLYLHV